VRGRPAAVEHINLDGSKMEKGLKIVISGAVLAGKDIDIFQRRISQRVIAMAPKAEIEYYNFARLEWRFEFTAVEFDINKVDQIHQQLKRLINEFLDKWIYKVNINFIESGGV